MKKILIAVALAAALNTSAFAGFNEGLKFFDAGNLELALQEFVPVAEKGGVQAQFYLGRIYEKRFGFWEDKKQAAYWYGKAAAQGHAESQYLLGLKYGQGEGVPKNSRDEASWYRKSAEQGNSNAQYNLCVMLAKGEGVPQDYRQSALWCRKAAEQGHVKAQYNLAIMYRKGYGVTQSDAHAFMLLNLAAANGDSLAEKFKNIVGKTMRQKEVEEGQTFTSQWRVGTPFPIRDN